jgi:hypothetical protein
MQTFLIINRLKTYFQVDTSNKLAAKLGVKPSTLTNWKVRNSIDWILIFTKCESINLNWLVYGEGDMLKDKMNNTDETCANDVNMLWDRINSLTIENHELKKVVEKMEKEKKFKKSANYDIAAEPKLK